MKTKERLCTKIALSIFFLLVLCRTAGAQDSQKATLTAADAGTCAATSTACLVINIPSGSGGATFNIGANASANTVQFEATADYGTTWVALNVVPSNGTTAVTSTTSTGAWQANVAGYTKARMRISTLVGGSTTAYINLSTASARSGGGGSGGSVFPVTVSGTVNSGGIPCFTSTTVEASSVLLGAGVIPKGGGAGACVGASSITDNATKVITTEPLVSTQSVQAVGAAAQVMNLYVSGGCDGISACTGFFWGLQAPASLAASLQYTPPIVDGAAGDGLTTDGSQHMAWAIQRRTLTGTAYTNATTTFSNVVGSSGQTLQFTVAASSNYKISCDIEWQGSANTTGPKWQWTGPASPTALVQYAHNPVTTSTYLDAVGSKTAFSSPMADTGTITAATDFVSHLDLELVNGVNAGTVVLQAAANGVGTLTIQPGSSCVSNGDK